MNNRILSLDVLRAIAILAVLLLHSAEFLTNISPSLRYMFAYGWIGVDLFFVLSGFLIGQQAFKSNDQGPSPIKSFILKRFFRTMPLYYIVLLVYLLIKPLAGYPFNDSPLKYFFFLQNFFSPKDFVQSWSLCIEEQFYLLFPLAFFTLNLKRIPSYFWLLPGIFSLFYRCLLYYTGVDSTQITNAAYNYHFVLFSHLDGISWGLFLASSFENWKAIKKKLPFLFIGLTLLAGSLIYITPYNTHERVIPSFQVLALSFSLILVGLYDLKRIPFAAAFHHLAMWSYGLYLWNNLTVRITQKILPNSNDLFRFIFFFGITILISAITYYCIEKPILKYRDKIVLALKS